MTYEEEMMELFNTKEEDNTKEEKNNTDELKEALDFLDQELENELVTTDTKDIVETTERYTMDSLTDTVLQQVDTVNSQADNIYNLFYQKIVIDKDRSEATSNNLVESLKVKNENIKAITELVKAKAKLESAKTAGKGSGGVYIQAQTGAEVGIDLGNLS